MTRTGKLLLASGVGLIALIASTVAFSPRLVPLLAQGEDVRLRADGGPALPPKRGPELLVLALDGVDRALLYNLLEQGALPELASLLGGADGGFAHAAFHGSLLATLPSSTLAAWATVFTGAPPAAHGVAGNEYFVREERRFAAPAPVSITDPSPVLATYTDGYANKLLAVPTVYDQLRRADPSFTAWVSMSQFFAGADRLLLAKRTVVGDAFTALLASVAGHDGPDGVYAKLDAEVIDTLVDALEKSPAPQMMTVYLTGADHFAHGAEAGPDEARKRYLREVLEPLFRRLGDGLRKADALERRTVVVTSDHGHTEVLHDDEHALGTDDADEPPAVVRGAGFRLRPLRLEVDAEDDFQAVLAYGGAMAYVYAADRSTCPAPGRPCDWARPPRYEADVLPLADAFYEANRRGVFAPGMKGALDLVLTRRPRPFAEDDAPFEVYVGKGKTEPLGAHLAQHPRASYVATVGRLADLAVGRFGERAGDVLLLARNGNEPDVAQRRYFAGLYRSWHGSPSRKDSEVPLIVAHPHKTKAELTRLTRDALGGEARQQDLGKLFFKVLALPEARDGG